MGFAITFYLSWSQLIPARGRKSAIHYELHVSSNYPRKGTKPQRKKECTLRKLTLEATLGALLHDMEPTACPEAAAKAVAFARRLVAGSRWGSAKLPNRSMCSIFTHLNGEHPNLFLPITVQDGMPHFPQQDAPQAPEGYASILEKLGSTLSRIQPEEGSIPHILRLLEDHLSFVPVSDEEPDLSRFDLYRITAAVASCMTEYLAGAENADCLEDAANAGAEKAFLLYSADFSGIQKFIFTVASKGALPSLRSRSFFLELLMEHYIDELLCACGMSRVNLLYSGGGHCYLLLPNTPAVKDALSQWNTRFNDWLLAEFGSQLFIAQGWAECSGHDLTNTPAAQAPYTAMFRQVSAAIAAHKLHRYSADQLRAINGKALDSGARECIVCGRSDGLADDGRCAWCSLFVTMSRKILDCPVYLVSQDRTSADFALPGWQGNCYFSLTNEKTACARLKNGEAVRRIYTKNLAFAGLPNGVRLYVGDYAASRELEALAANSRGITRLAVCRMDVDNLGHAFVAGYRIPGERNPEKRDRYLNIARTSAFSRQMSLFFKCYINPILEAPEANGQKLSVAIVYSGGDDVFLVGAWNDVITAVQRIQSSFERFCGGSLTISAGISIHDDHFPIRQAAAHSAELEDHAKQLPGKNALALFDPEQAHTYGWKEFREQVLGEKLKALNDFFHAEEQERGNAFLYQLLELLRQGQAERINLARYAYLLARMEPRDKARQAHYRAFSQSMYRWALTQRDRQQLITAIYLFVYAERKAK